ncbi:MAG: hypothetical protein AAGJ82_00150 [Bacteroidota bacterium]
MLIVLGLGVALLVLNTYAKWRLERVLTTQEHLTYEALRVNVLTGSVRFSSVQLEYPLDSVSSVKLRASGRLRRLSYWQYVWHNNWSIQALTLDSLAVQWVPMDSSRHPISPDTTADARPKFTIHQFRIKNGKLRTSPQLLRQAQVDSVFLSLSDLVYVPQRDRITANWEATDLAARSLSWSADGSSPTYTLAKLRLSPTQKVQLTDLRVTPKKSKRTFAQNLPHRKARIELAVPAATLEAFALAQLVEEKTLSGARLLLANSYLDVFVDKSRPDCTSCRKRYFYEILADLPLRLRVDTVNVTNGNIALSHLRPNEEQPGQLDWSKIDAVIANFSTVKTAANTPTTAHIEGYFMDHSAVQVHFSFPFYNPAAPYYFSGQLELVNLAVINDFLVFAKRIRIAEGKLNHLRFEGSGDLRTATGEIALRYDDLRLSLLNEQRGERKLASRLVNAVISRNNNPNQRSQLKTGRLYAERQYHKSFFSNWWFTLQSGIQSSVLPNLLLPKELDGKKEQLKNTDQ